MRNAPTQAALARLLPTFLICLVVLLAPAYAQNENEAVGFQSHHAFQDGVYGESIDIQNGAVNLVTPIGPRFQLNRNLGYQIQVFYGSKIWDSSVLAADPGLIRRGALGLGNALHFGRIYRDVGFVNQQSIDRNTGNIVIGSDYECTWFYVSPDGNEHVLPGTYGPDQGPLTCGDAPVSGYTIDSTFDYFYPFSGVDLKTWDGTGASPILRIETPDGIRYIFNHFVQVYGGTAPNLKAYNAGNTVPGADAKVRRYNRDYGGWYVGRIEDKRAPTTVYVNIQYETGVGFEHLISAISDSAGRQIDFTNECAINSATSRCYEGAFGSNDLSRPATRVKSISLPSFADRSSIDPTHHALYGFTYDWRSITNIGDATKSEPANVLRSIAYPSYTPRSGGSQTYALLLDYNSFGELQSRQLPTGARVLYGYNFYDYLSVGRFGAGLNLNALSRDLETKSICLTGADCKIWSYTRQATSATNPRVVLVTDPFGNDTLYYYHASVQDASGHLGQCAEDGTAPEWNDGLNYRTEYYQGSGAGRTLVRMETQEHDADVGQACALGQRSRNNLRVTKAVTTYVDDSSRQSTVSNSDWDGRGHWQTVTEIGGDVSGIRTTRTEYFDHDPGRFVYREVTDGKRVLSRTDNVLAGGDPVLSISRLSLPATPGTPASTATANGDIVTGLAYDANSNLNRKDLGDQGATGSGVSWQVTTPRYSIRYQWQGGYLLAKTFYVNPSTSQEFPWKAIDRDRDGNTGLIFASRDTAGIGTRYGYDDLGRLTDITPSDPAESATGIEYVSITKTSVVQGTGGNYTCDPTTGDFLASCYDYDELGRLVKTQKRPYDPSLGNPYQTIDYDIAGRMTFMSEWLWPGQAPCTASPSDPSCGTTYDFHDPANPSQFDPFGRVRKVTTADGKITQTDYFGQNTRITVNGIQGTAGLFNATTTYTRDTWGRLIQVRVPDGGGTNADYLYDQRDNLIQADLTDKATGKKQTRLFQYDGLNRLYSTWNPENGTTDYLGYDPLGNLTEQVDASGTHLVSTYDRAGRLSQLEKREDRDPGHVTVVLKTNLYDEGGLLGPSCVSGGGFGCSGGRLTTSTDYDDLGAQTLSQSYAYGGLNGRLSKVTPTFAGRVSPGVLSLAYNSFGLESVTTYPEGLPGKGGSFAIKSLFANGYVASVIDAASLAVLGSAQYNAAGGVQVLTTLGNASTKITADARNRPAKITIGAGAYDSGTDSFTLGTFYRSGLYGYDGAGNIATIGQSTYRYDAASRLVQAVEQVFNDPVQRKHVFRYDDYGNMTNDDYTEGAVLLRSDVFTVTDQATSANTNQIRSHQTTTTDPATLIQTPTSSFFSYDPRGNLITADTQESNYDSRNRIAGVRLKAGHPDVARYAYDGAAARVWKEDASRGVRTYYVRDPGGRLLSEFRGTRAGGNIPEWTKHYVYLGNRLVAMKENQVPGPVGGLAATTSTNFVKLTWSPNPAEDGAGSYNVYRTEYLSGQPYIWVAATGIIQPAYSDTTVTSGRWYEYIVTAHGITEGTGSDPLVVQVASVTAPPTPTGLTALAGDRRVDLTWSANAPGDFVIGYNVYRNAAATPLNNALLTIPYYADLDLTNGTYKYTVTAVNAWKKESAKSSPAVNATPRDYTRPGPPQNVTASADCTSGTPKINVRWSPPAANSDVAKYLVYRALVGCTINCTTAFDVGTQTTYADSGVTVGATYQYQVVAVDASGNSSSNSLAMFAAARNVSGSVTIPTIPGVTAEDGKVTLRIVYPSTLPYPTMRIYRKQNAQRSCEAYTQVATISTVNGICSPPVCYKDYVDRTAPNGAAYDYALTNLNASNVESGYSMTVLATPLASPVSYNECIEDLHSISYADYKDGALKNDSVASSTLRRVRVRVQTPDAQPYHPRTATTAGGTQSFLQGYHLYNYHTPFTLGTHDNGSLAPVAIEEMKKQCRIVSSTSCTKPTDCSPPSFCDTASQKCKLDTGVPCFQDANCPANQFCQGIPYPHCALNTYTTCTDPSSCGGQSCMLDPTTYGYCDNDATKKCIVDTDCFPIGGTYQLCRPLKTYDVYLNSQADQGFNAPTWQQTAGGANPGRISLYQDITSGCFVLKAVYKVYENGQWVSVESGTSDNFNVSPTDPSTRCSHSTPATFSDMFFPGCPAASDRPPQPLTAPSVASAGATAVTVSWLPAGVCTNSFTQACSPGCTLCCSPDQMCVADPHYFSISGDNNGHCVPKIPKVCDALKVCTTPSGSPTQVCETGGIDGYKIYVSEDNFLDPLSQGQFKRNHAAASVDKNTTSYTFTGLSGNALAFQVASFANGGRLSEMSLASPTITPTPYTSNDPIPVPLIYKLDAFSNPGGLWIYWSAGGTLSASFTTYEILRSTTAGGPYTAITIDPNFSPCYLTTKTGGSCYDYTAPFDADSYYVVRAKTKTSASNLSKEAVSRAMPFGLSTAQPLRPPLNLNARAVRSDHPSDKKFIELSWCPNRTDIEVSQRRVSGYRIYRSKTLRGPYTLITPNQDVDPLCLDGKHRCAISASGGTFSITAPDANCTQGDLTTCHIVDTSVSNPYGNGNLIDETQNYVYYYVVTARDSSSGTESPYSVENQGWPNYCQSGACQPRYDPDNIPYLPCTLPQRGSLGTSTPDSAAEGVAEIPSLDRNLSAPYRVIGADQPVSSNGKFIGDPPPTPSPAPPSPNASVRLVFYHLDHLGSPIVLTDSTGARLSTHHYMPFGQEAPVVASTNTRQFTGHERDRDTGMDYMVARYYSSSLGRFMAVDPSSKGIDPENPQTWNRYKYAGNNPLAFKDPTGKFDIPTHVALAREVFRAEPAGRTPQDLERLARRVGAVDRGTSNVLLSYGLHFGGEVVLNHLVNQAIDAYARGDKSMGEQKTVEALHLAGDIHAHEETNALEHLVGKIEGGAANPDDPSSPGFSKRLSEAPGEMMKVWKDITTGHRRNDPLEREERGSFFSTGQEPTMSHGEYVDADGTHWSSARSVEAF